MEQRQELEEPLPKGASKLERRRQRQSRTFGSAWRQYTEEATGRASVNQGWMTFSSISQKIPLVTVSYRYSARLIGTHDGPLQRCTVAALQRGSLGTGSSASGNGRCSFRCRHGGARPTNRVAFLLCKTQLSVVRRAVSVLLRLNYFAFWLLPYMAGQTVSVGGQN